MNRVKARRNPDGTVVQTDRVRVKSCVAGNDVVAVGDIVCMWLDTNRLPVCPDGGFSSVLGFIRQLGADGFGDLIVRVDVIKTDPMRGLLGGEVWAYPEDLWKTFTEEWFKTCPEPQTSPSP
jgi:hypothetical protein